MKISEINVYPIKSLGGVSVEKTVVEARGLRYDRRWMLVDEKNNFLTQREHPLMAKFRVRIAEDYLRIRIDDSEKSVPFDPQTNETASVKIWQSRCRAKFYHSEINDWFSRALRMKCRLVFMPDATRRIVSPFYAVRKYEDTVSFADGYPVLLIGEKSLDDLNSRLENPISMNRFRPNLVVSGAEPFAEDDWKTIKIGNAIFHVVKPCARCVVTTIDQETGIIDEKEPLKTLATYRLKNQKILFGQNLIADNVGEMIKVGDNVEILA